MKSNARTRTQITHGEMEEGLFIKRVTTIGLNRFDGGKISIQLDWPIG